jgi:hypothetical protein
MTTTPAKLGEALRCWLIERCHRYGYHRVAPLFIGDRLSDVSALGILCVVGLTAFSHYRWTALLIVAGFAVFTILFVWPRWLISIVGATYEFSGRRRPRLFAQARRALRLTASLFSWRVLVTTLLLGMVGWQNAWLSGYFCRTSVSLLQATFIFSFAMGWGDHNAARRTWGRGSGNAYSVGIGWRRVRHGRRRYSHHPTHKPVVRRWARFHGIAVCYAPRSALSNRTTRNDIRG